MRHIRILATLAFLLALFAPAHAGMDALLEQGGGDAGRGPVEKDRGWPGGDFFPNQDPDYAIVNLTNNSYDPLDGFPNGYYMKYPCFNADGTRLAVAASDGTELTGYPGNRVYEIWIMDYDAATQTVSNFQQVTSTGNFGAPDVVMNAMCSWSPTDPDLLLFLEIHWSNPNPIKTYDCSSTTFATLYDPALDTNGYDVTNPAFYGTHDDQVVFGSGYNTGNDRILLFDGTYPSTTISAADKNLDPSSNHAGDRVSYYWDGAGSGASIYSAESGGSWTYPNSFTGDGPGVWAFYGAGSEDEILSLRHGDGWSSLGLCRYDSSGNLLSDLLGDAGTDFQWVYGNHCWSGPSGEIVFRAEEHTHGGYGNNVFLARELPSEVWVDDDFTGPGDCGGHAWGYDAFASVQDGVEGVAAGGTVHIAGGFYTGQVHVTKDSVALVGAGAGSTSILSPAALVLSFNSGTADNYPVVFVDGATGVSLADLTVDGAGQGNGNYRFVGVGFWNGDGSMTDVTVTGVMDTPFSGNQHGVAIYSYNDTGGPYAISMTDVLVEDYQKTGIALFGDGLTVDLLRVTTTGQGPTSVTAQNGIQVGYGAGGSLEDCAISGNDYTGGSWTASGFLPDDAAPLTVSGMTLDANQTSVYWVSSNGSFTGCSITNPTGDGFYAYNEADAKAGFDRLLPSPIDGELGGGGDKASMTVTVSDCDILGAGEADSWGMGAFSTSADPVALTATGCRFHDWDYGFVGYDYGYGGTVDAEVHNSGFASCTYAVAASESLDVVDASWNTYDASTPAGVAALIDGPVDYTPWAVSGSAVGPGYAVDLSELWVDDDSPQTGAKGRVQEGVDLVSGSTLHLAAGSYAENVDLDKHLSLIGAGSGDDPASNSILAQSAGGAGDPKVGVIQLNASGASAGDPLLIQDLRVEPTGMAGISVGRFCEATGTALSYVKLDNVHVKGTNGTPVTEQERGLYVDLNSSLTYLEIDGCAFDDLTYGWYLHKEVSADASTVRYVTVNETSFNHNNLKGIYAEKLSDATFTGCEVDGNGIWNASLPSYFEDWLAGVDINLKAGTYGNLRFEECAVTGNGHLAQHGIGLTVKGRGTGNNPSGSYTTFPAWVDGVVVEGGVYTGNERGLRFGEPGKENASPTNVVVSEANISGNVQTYAGGDGSEYGGLINTMMASVIVDARSNWWGDPSGPSGAGPGSGDAVSMHVLFDPWRGGNIICAPDPRYLTSAVPTNTVAVKYMGGGGGGVYGYSISLSWDDSKVSLNSVTEGPLLSGAGTTFFFVSGSGNSRTVDCVLTGDQDGVTDPGTMFTLSFTGIDYGSSPVDLTVIKVRDKENNALTGFTEDDGIIHVDITEPVVTNVALANLTLTHTDEYAKNTDDLQLTATVTDDYGLAKEDIVADLSALLASGGTAVPAESYGSNIATWTVALANVSLTADGLKTVTVTATDDLGNSGDGADDITADNTPPAALSGFDAAPHHERVALSWDDPTGSDVNYYGVLVRYDGGGDYPEYAVLGVHPADETGGDGDAYDGTGAVTGGDHSIVARDIYYYTAFAYDWALNYGPADGAAQDRATNYWLGDVSDDMTPGAPYDGYVDANDFNQLSAHYWEFSPAAPPTSPWNEADVGPTDDHSRVGIPTPDDYVDFEDLMIFAMNYNVVDPTGKRIRPIRLAGEREAGGPTLGLRASGEPVVGEEYAVALVLGGNAEEVKGASMRFAYDPETLEFVRAVPNAALDGPVFFRGGSSEPGGARLDLAVMGDGAVIHRSGELATLIFRVRCEGNGNVRFEDAALRDRTNKTLNTAVSEMDGEIANHGAARTRLSGAWPSPFNPTTTVKFELRKAGHVVVDVYDVNGRQIRTLVDEHRPAGEYDAFWDGRDNRGRSISSGVYFVRMRSGKHRFTSKVILLK